MLTPYKLQENITNNFGNDGRAWLEELPNLLKRITDEWQLTEIEQVANLSYNYVCTAYSALFVQNIVCKLACNAKDLQTEVNALNFYEGKTCVKLLAHNTLNKAICLERLSPATNLKTSFPSNEDEAIKIAVKVMQDLHNVPLVNPNNFPTISDWLEELNMISLVPEQHLAKAKLLKRRLFATQEKQVLLHGDLHHENILQSGSNWVVIDPKGVIGEIGYEVGVFIYNPIPELLLAPDPKAIISRRIKLFSEILDIDMQRICDLSYVRAILSAVWCGESDKDGADYMLRVAEIIETIN